MGGEEIKIMQAFPTSRPQSPATQSKMLLNIPKTKTKCKRSNQTKKSYEIKAKEAEL